MKKNDYVAPEMEVVEFTEQDSLLLNVSMGGNTDGPGWNEEDDGGEPV